MRRFMRLFHNEWTKLFSRPLVYIMIGIILLITFLFGLIIKQNASNRWELSLEDYKKDWQRYMRSYIAQLETQKSGALSEKKQIIEGENGQTIHIEEGMSKGEEGGSAVYFDAMIEYVEYCIEKGIDGSNWRLIAMNEMANLRAEIAGTPQGGDTAAAQAKLDQLWGFVESGDWRGYVKYSYDSMEFGEGMEAEKKAQKEQMRLRLDYNIEPYNSPHSDMYISLPWRETVLSNYRNLVVTLETGLNTNGQKLSDAEIKRTKNEIKTQEYRL